MTQSAYTIEALLKGLRVLSLFTRDTPKLTLTEIKSGAALNKTTAYRVVSTLEEAGFLERDSLTKQYRPGLKVLQLGFTALSSLGFRQVARVHLEQLAQQVGRTVSLAVLDGMDVVYVDRVRQKQVYGVVLGLGSRIPAHCSSLGKAMLAYLPAAELFARLASESPTRFTESTLITAEGLSADLEKVRRHGFSINDEEWIPGLRSTASPILDDSGAVIGAVNISVSAAEVSRAQLEEELAPAVLETARRISAALGHAADIP